MTDLKDLEGQRFAVVLNDGVPRDLKFDFRAMREIDERYGLDKLMPGFEPSTDDSGKPLKNAEGEFVLKILPPKVDNGKLSVLLFMIWAGTLWLKQGLTEDGIADLMPSSRSEQANLMIPVWQAFGRDYAGKQGNQKKTEEQPPEMKS